MVIYVYFFFTQDENKLLTVNSTDSVIKNFFQQKSETRFKLVSEVGADKWSCAYQNFKKINLNLLYLKSILRADASISRFKNIFDLFSRSYFYEILIDNKSRKKSFHSIFFYLLNFFFTDDINLNRNIKYCCQRQVRENFS